MPNTSGLRCPGCAGPIAVRASIRVEYRELAGETIADEVDTDALRCANAACPYAFTDLAEITEPWPPY
jgi:hypothetical protein